MTRSRGTEGGAARSRARYLVATDLSPAARDAAAFAGGLARRKGAAVHLVTVLPAEGGEDHGHFLRVSGELDAEAEALRQDGVECSWAALRSPDVPAALLHEAERVGAETIVVGDAVVSREERLAPSGVTERLMREAPARVLLARPGRTALPSEILAAVDLGDGGAELADRAVRLAEELGIPVRVLHAVEPPDMLDRRLGGPDPARLERARAALASILAELLPQATVAVTLEVVEEDPVAAVERAARTSDGILVVAATRTKPLLSELLLGSVARTLASRIDAPVLLLRARVGEAQGIAARS